MTDYPMAKYPNPRQYVEWVQRCKAAVNDGRRIRLSWNGADLDGDGLNREVWRALDRRINDRGGLVQTGRKFDSDYQTSLRRDCYRVRDIIASRLRVYQFETPEIRRRYGHLLSSYND